MSATAAIGIMAYNEERNIGALLDSVLAQKTRTIVRIVVVASGCTDGTCKIVSQYSRRDPRITLIEEPDRAGKTSAVNKFLLTSTEEILMVSSADLIFEPNTVVELVRPFDDDAEVGMVGAHPIPLNANDNFFGYASNLMWQLHHEISLHDPKMGELIAFRNVFRRLNPTAICDELSVHQLVRSAGYKVAYAPRAIVHNKGPENLSDFVSQRMHCIVGNLQVMRDHNVPVSTMRILPVVRAALPLALRNWRRLHWTAGTAIVEFYCRLKAQSIFRSQKERERYQIWDPAKTTKTLSAEQSTKIAR